jgi:hypothetical protein
MESYLYPPKNISSAVIKTQALLEKYETGEAPAATTSPLLT